MSFRRATIAVAILALSAVAAPVHAVTSIASYTTNGLTNIVWRRSLSTTGGSLYTITTSTGTRAGATDVSFSFLQSGLDTLTNLDAAFTFSATAASGNPDSTSGGSVTNAGLDGSFSFIYTGTDPLVVGSDTYNTGANLLSGTFTNADITGAIGGKVGVAEDAGSITYTSDLIDFSGSSNPSFSLDLGPIGNKLAYHLGKALRTFRATNGDGSFAADSAVTISGNPTGPINLPPLGVPEPATWAMMLLGVGGIGAALRVQRKKAVSTLA
jgi:hypothetical protein